MSGEGDYAGTTLRAKAREGVPAQQHEEELAARDARARLIVAQHAVDATRLPDGTPDYDAAASVATAVLDHLGLRAQQNTPAGTCACCGRVRTFASFRKAGDNRLCVPCRDAAATKEVSYG